MKSRRKCDLMITGVRAGTDLAKEVGARLRQERKAVGLTLEEVGERVGVSHAHLSRVERGQKAPSLSVLDEACSWRGKGINWFLSGDEGIYQAATDEEIAAEERARLQEAAQLVIDVYGGVNQDWVNPERLCGAVAEVLAAYGKQRAPHRLPITHRASADPNAVVAWDPVEPGRWFEIPEEATLIEVHGESMLPLARDGQHIVGVEQSVDNGDLAAVQDNKGRLYFKRVWWRKGRRAMLLESVRREIVEPPVALTAKQIKRVWKIIGVLF